MGGGAPPTAEPEAERTPATNPNPAPARYRS